MFKPDKSKEVAEGIYKASIPGVFIIQRPKFTDNRGFFHEIFRLKDLEKAIGNKFRPVQMSHSQSLPRVIRAIHTEEWQKLIYPVTGKMFAAIVDVRPDSKAFGKVETFVFDNIQRDAPHFALFLAPGMGNSICVVGNEPVEYVYLVDEYWDNSKAKGIAWDDPDLKINWPIKNPILSERDRNNPTLRELYPKKFK